jgi:pSer/pThr/pTyr-binding forkhead associated (FHA) protein
MDVDERVGGHERETAVVPALPVSFIMLEVQGEPRVFDPSDDRRIIIGRHPDCDIALNATANASRKHAMILYDREKGWILQDLDSRNGVFLNETRVERAILNRGDTMSIGGQSMRGSEMSGVKA